MDKKRKLLDASDREETTADELDPSSAAAAAADDAAATEVDTTAAPNPDPIEEDANTAQHPNGAEPPAIIAPDPGPNDDVVGEERDAASIQKLLDPLPKDLLVELLRDAAAAHADVLTRVHAAAEADPVHRKIFVHGLGWDTTTDALRAAFLPYGEIDDCKAVSDKISGRSKGYGFVLFKNRSGARNALREPQKKIGSRTASCQLASTGAPPAPYPHHLPALPHHQPVSEYTQRKIYVSNVGAELDPQKLTEFFAGYGEIEEGPLGLDKVTGKPRGFCLFVYRAIESARKALEEPHKNFQGHVLHCQKAIDGPKIQKLGFGSQPLPTPGTAGYFAPAGAAAAGGSAAGLNPTLNQAISTLLGSHGSGLGLLNAVSGANQAVQNPGVAGMYANQMGGPMEGYSSSRQMHGSYSNMPGGSAGGGHMGMGQYKWH